VVREGFLKDKCGPRAKKFEHHWFMASQCFSLTPTFHPGMCCLNGDLMRMASIRSTAGILLLKKWSHRLSSCARLLLYDMHIQGRNQLMFPGGQNDCSLFCLKYKFSEGQLPVFPPGCGSAHIYLTRIYCFTANNLAKIDNMHLVLSLCLT